MNIYPTDNVTNLLQTFLDVQSRRSEVIAGNIANANTPGYVAKELDFEEHLRDAVRFSSQTQAERANSDSLTPLSIVEQESGIVGLDGNTVDAGREMASLAETSANFNFGAKMLQSRLRLLRTAIREGR